MDHNKAQVIKIGEALLDLGLQNSHSGNVSLRAGREIYITKRAVMKGHLKEKDIIKISADLSAGIPEDASSETGLHRRLLATAGAAIHAHSLAAIILSLKLNQIQAVDVLGKQYLPLIPVLQFKNPASSIEMELGVADALVHRHAAIVRAHGPVTRGKDLSEALFYMGLVDHVCVAKLLLLKMGVKETSIKSLTYPVFDTQDFTSSARKYTGLTPGLANEIDLVAGDLFKMKLSPYGTGSMSCYLDDDSVILVRNVARPKGNNIHPQRFGVREDRPDFITMLHQLVYRHTTARAAIIAHIPESVALAIFLRQQGEEKIIPADVEGQYLYPTIPLLAPDTNPAEIVETAEKYKMVVMTGMGVLALGENLGQCLHHVSALKNIAYINIQLQLLSKLVREV